MLNQSKQSEVWVQTLGAPNFISVGFHGCCGFLSLAVSLKASSFHRLETEGELPSKDPENLFSVLGGESNTQ